MATLTSSSESSSARRASLDTRRSKIRFKACPSSKSKWITIKVPRCKNSPSLSNRLNKKSKKRKPSWRPASKSYEPSAKRCLRLRTSTRPRRRTTMLSLSKWKLRRSRSRRTWDLSSRNIRRLSQSSTRTTCRQTSLKPSRRGSNARRNTFQIQTSA